VPASQVLYEAMPGDHDPGAAILLKTGRCALTRQIDPASARRGVIAIC
jgi:hypothetical protein